MVIGINYGYYGSKLIVGMVGVKFGVYVVQFKFIQVLELLVKGNKFIEWDEVRDKIVFDGSYFCVYCLLNY